MGARKAKNLAGTFHGLLEVLGPAERAEDGRFQWRCYCHGCEREVVRKHNSIHGKDIKSCGKCQLKYDKDLTGKEYGKLTVQYEVDPIPVGNKGANKRAWLCHCSCGNKNHIALHNNLVRHRSLACQIRDGNKVIRCKYERFGDITQSIWGKIVDQAIDRDLDFEISMKFGWDLFLKQDRKCALTNTDLYFPEKTSNLTAGNASLDRIDSSRGYYEDNVQWVTKQMNRIKNEYDEDDLGVVFKNYLQTTGRFDFEGTAKYIAELERQLAFYQNREPLVV